MKKPALAFWIIFATTMGIYAIMLIWSLPILVHDAAGQPPFDMRPAGYTFEQARGLLAAYSRESIAFYRDIQLGVLDMAYPAMLALTLFLAIGLLAPQKWGVWRWVLALAAIPGTVFDYLENSMIRLMLFLGPDNITPEIVALASERSVLKARFTMAAMSVLLVLLLLWTWKRFRPARS